MQNKTSAVMVLGKSARSKIIRKPWSRAESVRDVKRAKARQEIIAEFRDQQTRGDAKSKAQRELIEFNAYEAFDAILERQAALAVIAALPITDETDRHGNWGLTENERREFDAARKALDVPKTSKIRLVQDVPDSFELVTGDSVEHVLDTLGAPSEARDFGFLLVEVLDGDYGQVYGGRNSVPFLLARVENVSALVAEYAKAEAFDNEDFSEMNSHEIDRSTVGDGETEGERNA